MKISLQWLNEFVDVHEYFERPEQLASLLTSAGLEVEEIHDLAQQFKFVQIGLILEKDKHPDADKLSVCKVTTGEGVVHQIVCGAKNHKANDRVIVALPGAILPGNFAIKNSVIRGIASGGMLCSYKELGMATESEGIAILPESAEIGARFSDYAQLNDVTFELKVTPNRADCLSHRGLAREVACLINRPFKTLESKKNFKVDSTLKIGIEVLDPEMCPRYSGRILRNVKVGPSPEWLKKRLEVVGLNSINNVVDVTNYVMMEWGQPLHAFDLKKIEGAQLRIGKAGNSTKKFITLDGTELSLRGDELMIQDAQQSHCMAGVIGGKNSGVNEGTEDLFLESAYFIPQYVRKSSRAHGLNTDSGYRFSRGVDPTLTVEALNRAVELICEVSGSNTVSEVFEIKSLDESRASISISTSLASDRLGYKVDANKFESWMLRLGCIIEKSGEDSYKVTPPAWRFDLEIDMDLVEEYARLNGYENIPESLPPLVKPPTSHDSLYRFQSHLTDLMMGQGYSQAINFAFVSKAKQEQFVNNSQLINKTGLTGSDHTTELLNPLNDQLNQMRSLLSLGLVDNLQHNFHHGVEEGRLFEIGPIFEKGSSGEYLEHFHWAGLAWGWTPNLWTKDLKTPVVMDLKRSVEEVLTNLGVKHWNWLKASELGGVPHFLHPGQSVVLEVGGLKLGFLGTLHPTFRENLKVRGDAALFEFKINTLLHQFSGKTTVTAISKFPAVDRDLSLLMPKSMGAGFIKEEIHRAGGTFLQEVSIFDLFEGDKVQEGQKSVSFRLRYRRLEATLTDKEIQDSVDSILVQLNKLGNVSVR